MAGGLIRDGSWHPLIARLQPAVRRRVFCPFASVLGLSFAHGDSGALHAQHVAI